MEDDRQSNPAEPELGTDQPQLVFHFFPPNINISKINVSITYRTVNYRLFSMDIGQIYIFLVTILILQLNTEAYFRHAINNVHTFRPNFT